MILQRICFQGHKERAVDNWLHDSKLYILGVPSNAENHFPKITMDRGNTWANYIYNSQHCNCNIRSWHIGSCLGNSLKLHLQKFLVLLPSWGSFTTKQTEEKTRLKSGTPPSRQGPRRPRRPPLRPEPEPEIQKYRKEPAEIRCQDFKKKNLESPWLTKPLRIHGMLDRPEATSAKQNVSCSHFANRAKRDNTSLNTHFDKNSSIWSWSLLLRHVCCSASSWSDTECLKGQFGYAEAFDVCWMNHDHNSMCSKTHHRKANMWSSKWIVNVRRQHFCLDASSSQVSYLEVQNESPACTKHQSHSVAGEMSSLRFILWKITSNIDQWE